MRELAPALERTLLAAGVSAQRMARARTDAAWMESSVEGALVERGALSEEALTRALSDAFGLPAWDGRLSEPLVELFTVDRCRYSFFVPIARRHDRVLIATSDPMNASARMTVQMFGALDVDVMVAADSVIARTLDTLSPYPSASDLEDLAKEERAGGAMHRLANVLLTAATRTGVTGVRIELGPEPRLFLEVDGVWCAVPWAAQVSRRMLGGAAARILSMAAISELPAPARGQFRIVVTRAHHGGRCVAFEVAHTRTTSGLVVVARRRRTILWFTEDAERALLTDDEQVRAALDRGAIDEARLHVAGMRERAIALDGEDGAAMLVVLDTDALVHFWAGQWDRASILAEQLASHRHLIDPQTANLWTAALCARLAGDAPRAALLARRAMADVERLFGAFDLHGADALYELGLAQLMAEDVDGALASTERLESVADTLGHWVPIMAAHLRGSVALARADTSAALAAFGRAVAAVDSTTGTPPMLAVPVFHDHAMLLRQTGRNAEAQRLLERARRETKNLPAVFPACVAVERALGTLPAHPYR